MFSCMSDCVASMVTNVSIIMACRERKEWERKQAVARNQSLDWFLAKKKKAINEDGTSDCVEFPVWQALSKLQRNMWVPILQNPVNILLLGNYERNPLSLVPLQSVVLSYICLVPLPCCALMKKRLQRILVSPIVHQSLSMSFVGRCRFWPQPKSTVSWKIPRTLVQIMHFLNPTLMV